MNKKIIALFLILTVLTPNIVLADTEFTDVAVNQSAVASSEFSDMTSAEMANDGVNDNSSYTAWVSADEDVRPFWQTDLAVDYKISEIIIEARKDCTVEERSNFRVLLSNDEKFADYIVAGQCSEDYGKDGIWSAKIEDRNKYQYVRVEKTTDGALSIGEIKILVDKSTILYGTQVNDKNLQQPNTDASTRYDIPVDVIGKSMEDEVKFLSALNIMRGYPDGKFLPDEYITRAEFASVAAKLTGGTLHVSENTFSDVTNEHWAYDAIETCFENGLISGMGNGNFVPDEQITYNQALKIMVCALGYDALAKDMGGYPEGYIKVASQLGISKGTKSDEGYITRGNIAKLVYNTLFTKMMNIDSTQILNMGEKTIIADVFKVSKTKGLISEVSGTSLTDQTVERNGEKYIVVNGMHMRTEDPYANDYLGYVAEVYYKEADIGDDYDAIAVILSKKSVTKEIQADYAIGFDSSAVLTYRDENDRRKKLEFELNLDVIYNNKPLLNYTHESLLPGYGTIRAIDNDGDGKYEVMLIRAVETRVVNWVDVNGRTIYLKPLNGSTTSPLNYKYDEDNVTLYNSEGEAIDFSELEEWNVLSMETSANTVGDKITNIYVSDKFVRGSISKIDEEYVTVRNKQYKFAETMDKSKLKLGNNSIFYLDYYGRIAAFDDEVYNSSKYGFITRIYYDEGLDKTQFRIFTSSGSLKTFFASDKLKIDKTKCVTRDAVVAALMRSGGTDGAPQQLVKYTLNSKDEINEIDTIYKGEGETAENSLSRDFEAADRYYRGEDGTFDMVLTLADNSFVFNVPEDIKNEGDYTVGAAFKWDAQNKFEAYDCGSLNDAKVVLVRAMSDEAINVGSPFFVVDKVYEGLNRDEEPATILCGWYEGKYVSYPEKQEGIIEAQNLKRGDIVCVSLSSNKEIKQIEKRFYEGSRPVGAPNNSISTDTPMGPGTNTPFNSYLFLVYGTVIAKNDKYLKVKTNTRGTAPGYTLPQPNYETIIVTLDNPKLKKYIYDSDENEVRLAENSDFVDAESAGVGSTVVLRSGSGQVVDIVILK